MYSPAGSAGSNAAGANILVNYGNETMKWYNQTSFRAGSNFYNLTLYLTGGNVEAPFYGPPLNEHFVTAINGIKNQDPYYWTLWMFCQKQNSWAVSPTGADLILLASGLTIAWAYEIPYHAPVPRAKTVDSCS